jgi:hypothetical protein
MLAPITWELLVIAVLVAGCATGGEGSGPVPPGPASRQDPLSRLLVLGALVPPGEVAAERTTTGQWPSKERIEELLASRQPPMSLCTLGVAFTSDEEFHIEYRIAESNSDRCSDLYIARTIRVEQGDYCYKSSISERAESGAQPITMDFDVTCDPSPWLKPNFPEMSGRSSDPERERIRDRLRELLGETGDTQPQSNTQ